MTNTLSQRIPFILLLAALLLQAAPAMAAEIEARVSRDPVALGESFDLILESTESPDGSPDLAPIQRHFDIVNQSRSHSMRSINGRVETTTSWKLTLLPRKEGEFVIPPIAFGKDRSRAIRIKVEQGAASSADKGEGKQDLYLEVAVEPKQVFVQQQAILTIRLFRAVNMGDASLTPPEHDDVVIQKLGDDEQFEKRVNGRVYAVTERKYVLFPQRSGKVEIPPIRFQGEVFEKDPGLGRFFGSPFGGRGFGQVRRMVSEPITLDVQPIPDQVGSGAWLPASNLQLAEAWPNDAAPEFQVGEPVTRTLLLLADGLTSAQLPQIAGDPGEFIKQYPDQPSLEDRVTGDGITGIRREKMALVPTRPGRYTLPAIEIRWWNLDKQRFEVARVDEREILVKPAPGKGAPPPATAQQGTVEQGSPDACIPEPEQASKEGDGILAPPASGLGAYWPWISAALAILWLATLATWWRCRRMAGASAPARAKPQSARSPKPDSTPIKKACADHDPRAATDALLNWAQAKWPDQPPRSLGALATRLGGDSAEQIRGLEKILYAPDPEGGWRGDSLWNAWQAGRLDRDRVAGEEDEREGIAPLYPKA